MRDRSNFSLRRIETNGSPGPGDDRRYFSVRQLLENAGVRPEFRFDAGVISRDFEVRPEWNGNSVPSSSTFRSFINDPKLLDALSSPTFSARLVTATLDDQTHKSKLLNEGFQLTEANLQLMRLLARLRRALPPYTTLASPAPTVPLSQTSWTDDDIVAVVGNLIQATQPVSDANLLLYDRRTYANAGFTDPNVRIAVRPGPVITECALHAKRVSATEVQLTEFFEFWNPYPFPLLEANGQSAQYYYGVWSGSAGSGNATPFGGLYNLNIRWTLSQPPAPGRFVVVALPSRNIFLDSFGQGVVFRARPYIQNVNYFSTLIAGAGSGITESSSNAISIANFYSAGGSQQNWNLSYNIPIAAINSANGGWASFQIDDPRMGPSTRYSTSPYPVSATDMTYSWQHYSQHTLPLDATLPLTSNGRAPVNSRVPTGTPQREAYNTNFGDHFGTMTYAEAMSTFALPRRPILHPGELAGVFAGRPWKTLKLDQVIDLFDDVFSTVGTTTMSTNLPFRAPGEVAPGTIITANYNARSRSTRWLVEPVPAPAGAIRPVRGRFSLNAIRPEALALLLGAPYRVAGTLVNGSVNGGDVMQSITAAEALAVANAVVAIRPVRAYADLRALGTSAAITAIRARVPGGLADAVLGRLVQYGSIRQQAYTLDVIAQAYAPGSPGTVAGEARTTALVSFDTFNRLSIIHPMDSGLPIGAAAEAEALTWTTGGEAPWFAQVHETHDGVDALRSGRVNPGGTSWTSVALQGPGTLTFWQKATFGANLRVERNTQLVGAQALSQWTRVTLGIPSGPQTVTWTSAPTASPDDTDGAWLDGVTYTPASAGYQAWAAGHFTPTELANDPLTTPMQDFNIDTDLNLLDYALNRSPRTFNRAHGPTQTTATANGQTYLATRFLRRKNAADLNYQVRTSPDLTDWTQPAIESGVEPGPTGDTEFATYRDTVPITGNERRFVRVGVEALGE